MHDQWLPVPAILFFFFALASTGCASGSDDATESATTALLALNDGSCPRVKVFAPGVISTEAIEGRISFTPDGRTAYFHRFVTEENRFVILESRRGKGDTWSPPVPVSFSTEPFDDFDPFVSPDGQSLYFASHRPVDGGSEPHPNWDIWVSTRTRTGWGDPVHLGAEVNSEASEELYPSTTWDGALYFNSDRAGGYGTWDIYRAPSTNTGYSPAENLGPGVNTEYLEFNPMPSPDGRFIVFGSIGRPENPDNADLYASVRPGASWLPARNLGPCINTAAGEFHPTLAWARESLLFVRDTGAGGDFYELPFRELLAK